MTRSTTTRKFSVALLLTGALLIPATPAFGAPPRCAAGDPACTTSEPYKNNDTFTVSQRGNLDAKGTEST